MAILRSNGVLITDGQPTHTPTTDNVIPVSVTPNETDTNNNFILELIP